MEETQQDFSLTNTDPDATLVQPRFDEAEAQTAQPVVPLARATAWRSRSLPVALVLVSALLGGLVSVAAYRLYQRSGATQTQATSQTRPQTNAQPTATQDAQTAQAATAHASDEAAPAQIAQPAERKPITSEAASKAEEQTARREEPTAHAEAAEPRAASRSAAAEKRDAQHTDETANAERRDAPRARRVDVIASPDATRRDRRRDDETTDHILRDPRGDRRPPRPKARNIDRIRDIFGAPPPSN